MAGNNNTKDNSQEKAFKDLRAELDFEYCLSCGACIAACPLGSIEFENGKPKLTGECTSCGMCYYQCPQFKNTNEVSEILFEGERKSESIGEYREAYSARASESDILEEGQDGGVVTALLAALLEEGYIDGAIVTVSGDEPWKPVPKIATTKEEILEGAGTIYSRGPIVTGVKEAIEELGLEKLAVVGTPCQMRAFRRMEQGQRSLQKIRSKVKLLVGLFCTEAFSYPNMIKIVEEELGMNIEEVEKMDITKGNFTVYSNTGSEESIPVKELGKYATEACHVCDDYSGELADISVGSVGAPGGYSAVLTRTDIGAEAFATARETGAFEAEPLNDVKPGLGLLEKLSSRKKEGNREEIEKRREEGQSLPPSESK